MQQISSGWLKQVFVKSRHLKTFKRRISCINAYATYEQMVQIAEELGYSWDIVGDHVVFVDRRHLVI